ncbi:hypothetical protein EMIT0P74_120084 [Pseudomonas sp. IT-P74]
MTHLSVFPHSVVFGDLSGLVSWPQKLPLLAPNALNPPARGALMLTLLDHNKKGCARLAGQPMREQPCGHAD